eukprot:TRINITY_DN4409_c0_g1_i5.p3 TRINITY_DN4409_c0_g1~~TRINITY_DN4409_c0_g1_i5.p3  ORF type:complete len:109 (-),score=28.06 TRINITY_DN4409_c0_g1_i5:332-658(-)
MFFFFFFSSRRRHTRCREVSWARRCVQETVLQHLCVIFNIFFNEFLTAPIAKFFNMELDHFLEKHKFLIGNNDFMSKRFLLVLIKQRQVNFYFFIRQNLNFYGPFQRS